METPFKFRKDDITHFIIREMKLLENMKNSFEYVHDKLTELGFCTDVSRRKTINFDKYKFDEGKSYNWYAIVSGKVKLLIRTYGSHFTIYTKLDDFKIVGDYKDDRPIYGAIIFHSDREKMSDDMSDSFCDNPFQDLENGLHAIIEMIKKKNIHAIWNSYSFIRPEHVDAKYVFNYKEFSEEIHEVDNLIFCAEELSSQHMNLFAQNDMLEHLKGLKDVVGKEFDHFNNIASVITEFSDRYSEPYYHGVGIHLVDKKNKSKTSFQDVYSLTRYNLKQVMKL